ncbi:hypothetical protein HYH03_015129 [Edaphochlamys debaryana]|uniref:Kinesin light chain n=1 Tax=Edaphochlamys debaryana TaxID=47281 RepID=A0A835XMH1_9CHLO|nr:hypothetical protein HYH03_015129 [Edaphochlamys debaryana]|eukprot:KAG2486165.1 hypothetical protein HYH03_015129 [Edaphochlamys debaryana]
MASTPQGQVHGWFNSLHPDIQAHSDALLPAEGRAVYLLGKGLSAQAAHRLVMHRDEASAGPGAGGAAAAGSARPLAADFEALRETLLQLGSSLPFPGCTAAPLALQLLELAEGAPAHRAELAALGSRAVALLGALGACSGELQQAGRYRQAAEECREALQRVLASAQPLGSRNCVARVLAEWADGGGCGALAAELAAAGERLVAAAGAAAEGDEELQEALALLRQPVEPQAPGADARALVSELGGMGAVAGDPAKQARVADVLAAAAEITAQEAALLLASHLDPGPQRLIPQSELRLLWRALFPGRAEALWPEWWRGFPGRLREAVPGMGPAQARELAQLLAGEGARAAFQQAVGGADPGAVSVGDLRTAFAADEALLPQVQRLLRGAAGAAAGAATSCCTLPPLPEGYTGREEEAAALVEHLRAHGSLALLGGGGMGKSCLAADVGWRLVRGGQAPGGALWVDLGGARSGAEVDARFCAALGMGLDANDNGQRIAAALDARAGPASRGPGVLVVVDGAEDALGEAEAAEALRGLVDKVLSHSPSARLLLTSRTSLNLPSPSPLLAERPLGPLGPAAAAGLVRAVAADVGEAEARRVAEACQGVPLALCLVAGALVAGRMSMQDLPALFADCGALVRLVLSALPQPHQQAAALLAVLPASFDEEAAAAALGLPSAAAARGLLAVLARHRLVAVAGPQRYSLQPLVRQQAALLGAGLGEGLQAAAEGRFVRLTLGRLGQWAEMFQTPREWMLAMITARERQADVSRMMELLAQPPTAVSVGSELAAVGGQLHAVAVAAALTDRLARLLGALTQLQGLRPGCEALLALLEGPQPGGATQEELDLAAAAVLHTLAYVENGAGRYSEAQACAKRSYELRLRLLGEGHPDTAIALAHLATSLHEGGRHAEAEPLFRRALELRRRVLGEAHPETASSVNMLAVCTYYQHRYDAAEPLYRQALALAKSFWGEEHPHMEIIVHNLAACTRAKDRAGEIASLQDHVLRAAADGRSSQCHADAEPLYRLLLQLQGGEEDPRAVEVLGELGACVHAQGRLPEAEPLYRQALTLRQQLLGEEHGDTAQALINLAVCIHAQGRLSEAEPLYRQALELRRRELGEAQEDTATLQMSLAVCIHAQGRRSEANTLAHRAVKLQQAQLPTKDVSDGFVLVNLLAHCMDLKYDSPQEQPQPRKPQPEKSQQQASQPQEQAPQPSKPQPQKPQKQAPQPQK